MSDFDTDIDDVINQLNRLLQTNIFKQIDTKQDNHNEYRGML